MKDRKSFLFLILGAFFICNALLAEFIGVKIFSVEETLGFDTFKFSFFGEDSLSFQMTTGVLLWPVVFVMTDIINEYFGKKGVQTLSYITVGLIIYAFLMISAAMYVTPPEWWVNDRVEEGIPHMGKAFNAIFGQSSWIIIGSLVAFLVGQFTDVFTFRFIRKRTGHKSIWLRATGSTIVSQLIDSFIVLFIAFYIGNDWSFTKVLAIGLVNYIYKFLVAILSTPLIYLAHTIIERYLGKEQALQLADKAD